MGTKKGAGQTAPTMEKPKSTEQAKNASIQADTDAHALPEITVRIANIGPFAVHGIRVFENDKGMFINMPSNSYTDAQGNKQYCPSRSEPRLSCQAVSVRARMIRHALCK